MTVEIQASARHEGITDTLDHLERLRARRDALTAAILSAEEQVGHRVGISYRGGRLSDEDALAIYARYRRGAEPGAGSRWGIPNWRPQFVRMFARNNGDGWAGNRHLSGECPRPKKGQCVVYFLFDEESNVCYVGSTQNFSDRLSTHRDTKEFVRWAAWPYPNREAAYVAEDEVLKRHLPRLNKRAGR